VPTDGRTLEHLVRQIEELLLPAGFSVTGNTRVYNDGGVQLAEFDVEIRGRLGSTDLAWLIECRDRPGDGPAPGSWIEQLVGRRDRFGFNKITAVSTTGFAEGAAEYARESGIELRTVSDIQPEDVASWLGLQSMQSVTRIAHLTDARLILADDEPEPNRIALAEKLRQCTGDTKILRASDSGNLVSGSEAFLAAVLSQESLFDDLQPNGPRRSVHVRASYPNDRSHFTVDVGSGSVRIHEILFAGELFIRQSDVPIEALREYRRDPHGQRISQTAMFPVEAHGMRFSLEFHNLADTGQTHVLLRRVS
jgi:hypothetical protein